MGKLGKKARKFAKKNLQSVMKRKRKLKPFFKKKTSSRNGNGVVENQAEVSALSTGRELPSEDVEDTSLDVFTSDEDEDTFEDDSESEGYLSEDPCCSYAGGNDNAVYLEDASQENGLTTQNQKIQAELAEKKKKLEAFKQKDPQFATFLQDRIKERDALRNEELSDEDEMSEDDLQSADGDFPSPDTGRLLTSATIASWIQMVKDQNKLSVLPSLLNAYRAACHYGAESTNSRASVLPPKIQNQETFCNIIMFMLSEGDKLFRGILGISSNCKMEVILDLKTSSKWERVKPMIKSFLTSTLFLLNQFTEDDMLAFSLTRLKDSLIFFAAFPSLRSKLIEVAVHLWATGGGNLSSCSFLILHDVASLFGDESYDKWLKKTYKAMISRSKVVDPSSLKHIEYLKNSFVELCSIDLQKSVNVATTCCQRLAKVLQLGLQTKKKEVLKKICSWEYALCIDLWVTFVSVNIKDNGIHGLQYAIIQVIIGVASLFSGQRYMPLKVKSIRWLNHLSSSSEIFIPISSLVLDILESSAAKEVGKPGKGVVNLLNTLKLPKYWLKSRDFQEDCVSTAVELLCAHFLQWSHHISFPELATIPIIRLKQFHEKSNVESLKRTVKRLIDQVEKNIDFVQRKREDVSFSPKDQADADSFLQMERSKSIAPYIQYYKSVLQNATTRRANADEKTSSPEKKNLRRKKRKMPQKTKDGSANDDGEKSGKMSPVKKEQGLKSKKQRT